MHQPAAPARVNRSPYCLLLGPCLRCGLVGASQHEPLSRLRTIDTSANAFTAMADITLAALAMAALPGHTLAFICLLLASVSLYSAGMVWNDYFDFKQDLRERPFRPLPSGRVTKRTAAFLGLSLLAAGVIFAALADSAAARIGGGP